MQHTLLSLEYHPENEPGKEMNFKMQGEPADMAMMIGAAMGHTQAIAAAFMAAVLVYAHERDWKCGDIENLVSIPGKKL